MRPESPPDTMAESDLAPTRVRRPRRAAPADAVRPTRAEVNLGALRHNLHALRRVLAAAASARATQPPEVWGVLKADAYGHGAPAVARTLERAGIDGVCVALLEEAIELRDAGVALPTLVLGGLPSRLDGIEELLEHDATPVLHDAGQVERLGGVLREQGRALDVHLKIDTGMGRLGVRPRELASVVRALARFPEVRPRAVMTHLACADDPDPRVTTEQLASFAEATAWLAQNGVAPPIAHVANSAAALSAPSTHFHAVRPGLALFGVSPLPRGASTIDLRPAIRVRTELLAVRDIEVGEAIGYGHTFRAARPTRIATFPMGYADGLPRLLSNRGHVLVRGTRAPIVGNVSMDLTMIDVTDVPGARLGDEVVVLGAQEGPLGRDAIEADEIATHANTIAWEVLTSISRRVPRFYREP
jgi:alanine racemase